MDLENLGIPSPSSTNQIPNEQTVEDALNRDITFRLYKYNDQDIVEFFCAHVDELLKLAFTPCEHEISAKAFAILDHSNPTLTLSMLTQGCLNTKAQEVLSKPEPETIYLSRLSSLTFDAFTVAPDDAKEHCGFIFQMLYYLFEPSILSLFETTCSYDADPSVQQWLLSLKFDEILLKEMENIKVPEDVSITNSELHQICGLYNVLAYCATSPVMCKRFCTLPFVEVMYKFMGDFPSFVEDCRWRTISLIYCKETSEIMGGMFSAAIWLLRTPRAASLAGVSAIELLTHMITSDDLVRPFMTAADVIKLVLQLVKQYPYHSILQGAAREFLNASMLHQKTRIQAVSDIIPVALAAINGSVDRFLTASLYEILHNAINIGKTDPKAFAVMKSHDGFLDFVKGEYIKYNALLNRAYGGPIPGVCADIKNLISQTVSKRGF